MIAPIEPPTEYCENGHADFCDCRECPECGKCVPIDPRRFWSCGCGWMEYLNGNAVGDVERTHRGMMRNDKADASYYGLYR